jgi:hypothetical protein
MFKFGPGLARLVVRIFFIRIFLEIRDRGSGGEQEAMMAALQRAALALPWSEWTGSTSGGQTVGLGATTPNRVLSGRTRGRMSLRFAYGLKGFWSPTHCGQRCTGDQCDAHVPLGLQVLDCNRSDHHAVMCLHISYPSATPAIQFAL